ncbi:MAG: hypothetical protein KC505_03235 [Myxococcales bacterium]|nr:hypothetical protein [Myxococcales bacterium]USN51830.1 MAG: hypothetical protein H6731_05335 [Myxococcales bacterium]
MKKFLFFIFLILSNTDLLAEDASFGEEYILPLKYPKFFASTDYNMMRNFHGFLSSKLRHSFDNNWNLKFGFDVGLYKYFNAGVILSNTIPKNFTNAKFEPIFMHFSLYGKPYLPLGNRFSVFTRFGGGISISLVNILHHLRKNGSDTLRQEIRNLYHEQGYADLSPGAHAFASIGMEVFPFSRLGLALECGIQAEYYYSSKGSSLVSLLGDNKIEKRAPSSLQYLIYQMPITLSLSFIF